MDPIQEIAKCPGAKYVALLAQSVPSNNNYYPTAQWLLTGKGPHETFTTSEQYVYYAYKNTSDDAKRILNRAILEAIAKRSDADQICKLASLIRAVNKITQNPSYFVNFLITGEDPNPESLDPFVWNFIFDPDHLINRIVTSLNYYKNPANVAQELAGAYGLDLTISEGEEGPDDMLKWLLDYVSDTEEDIDDVKPELQTIHDYFYADIPPAPPAPSIAFRELVKQSK